ncbi:glycoside hydrolase family 2 TIM barrel-domain containing protein [Ochrovirga pacifica]|uniref:glycoside hydrolase family 2 TIM barrel-domain containing protein n=1 Tax=Ochrovirga pacifica TaxID=1042376 RepID=UPI0002559217|nr:glycoside hydrolase family 2 TIM barrel-domain containing protein [Ochrovirga pacifica]
MIKTKLKFLWILLFVATLQLHAQTRKVTLLEDWKFSQYDYGAAFQENFNDSDWKKITVPHDWAVEGEFSFANDIQLTMVRQDGETKPKYRHGRSGALPYTGVGWYRTTFAIQDTNKVYNLMFDGAMSHAKVYVNGAYVGERPNGYLSFYFDISKYLIKGKNVLAVRLENFNSQSRWYPGAGLYRKVTLTQKEPVHIPTWGTFVTTPVVTKSKATVRAEVNVVGEGIVVVQHDIMNAQGKIVASHTQEINANKVQKAVAEIKLKKRDLSLWSIENPNMYQLKTTLIKNDKTQDAVVTPFGIRTLAFKVDGFYLNGKKVRFKGVNMHHDLGPTGAAFYPNLFRRQMKKMKEMGVNAIRFSHNPPAPEALDICDEMGLLAIDEAFDEWQIGKVINGYSKHFDKWAAADLTDMVYRDRNHPSIIMWSIGNEINEQYKGDPNNITGFLNDVVKKVDTTRATTCGFNSAINALTNGMAFKVDVAGFNYKPGSYHIYRQKYPNLKFYASETGGAVSLRDTYKFPVVFDTLRDKKGLAVNTKVFKDGHPGNYETTQVRWGYAPFKEFASQDYNQDVYGEFVWTGYDYLGEPSPYHEAKSRSSYFAPVDFVGLEKDKFYLYKGRWNTAEKVLHAFPHWSNPAPEGTTFPVVCYTNYAKAELFINGKSYGVKTKEELDPSKFLNKEFSIHGSGGTSLELMKMYAIVWEDITYQPGELKVVAYDKRGKAKETLVYKTAKPAAKITITPEVTTIKKGEVVVYRIIVTDANGNWQPNYEKLINIEVSGAGEFLASGNGDPTNLQTLTVPKRNFYKGKAVVFVKAVKTGTIKIKVKSEDFSAQNQAVFIKE